MSNLSLGVKKIFKEIMTYMATPQQKNPCPRGHHNSKLHVANKGRWQVEHDKIYKFTFKKKEMIYWLCVIDYCNISYRLCVADCCNNSYKMYVTDFHYTDYKLSLADNSKNK